MNSDAATGDRRRIAFLGGVAEAACLAMPMDTSEEVLAQRVDRMEGKSKAGASVQRRIDVVRRFLQTESTLVLSTCGPDGRAHATPLYYVLGEALDLYWISSKSSRHSVNLGEGARASVAVFRATFEWRRIAGVQMEGECAEAEKEERALYLPVYRERFRLGTLFSQAIALGTMYRFRPRWLRYLDNSKRMGGKFEIEL